MEEMNCFLYEMVYGDISLLFRAEINSLGKNTVVAGYAFTINSLICTLKLTRSNLRRHLSKLLLFPGTTTPFGRCWSPLGKSIHSTEEK